MRFLFFLETGIESKGRKKESDLIENQKSASTHDGDDDGSSFSLSLSSHPPPPLFSNTRQVPALLTFVVASNTDVLNSIIKSVSSSDIFSFFWFFTSRLSSLPTLKTF